MCPNNCTATNSGGWQGQCKFYDQNGVELTYAEVVVEDTSSGNSSSRRLFEKFYTRGRSDQDSRRRLQNSTDDASIVDNDDDYFQQIANLSMPLCPTSDPYCKAKCSCYSGYYGSDCSLGQSEFDDIVVMRDTLCSNLNATRAMQDVDLAVVMSRATVVADILLDLEVTSDFALAQCTDVLVSMVLENADLTGNEEVVRLVSTALSNVLAKGSSISTTLLTDVEVALSALTVSAQSNMAVGEDPLDVVTDGVRVKIAVGTSNTLSSENFTVPQSDYEAYAQRNTPSLNLNTSVGDLDSGTGTALGVAVLSYANEPGSGNSGNVTSVGLETQTYSSFGSNTRRARRLAEIKGLDAVEAERSFLVSRALTAPRARHGRRQIIGAPTSRSQGSQTYTGEAADVTGFVGLNGFYVDNLPSRQRRKGLGYRSHAVAATLGAYVFSDTTVTLPSASNVNDLDRVLAAEGSTSAGLTSIGLGVTVVLYNKEKVEYDFLAEERDQVICYGVDGVPYMQAAVCASGFTYEVQCPGKRAIFNTTCPSFTERPLCTVYDETLDEFVTSDECFVESYDEYSTTCRCVSDTSSRRRHLLSTSDNSPHDGLYYMNGSRVSSVTKHRSRQRKRQLASSSATTSTIFSSEKIVERTVLIMEYYEANDFSRMLNDAIFITVALFVLIFAFGTFVFGWVDEREKIYKEKLKRQKQQQYDGVKLDEMLVMGSSHHKLKTKLSETKYGEGRGNTDLAEASLISAGALHTGRSKYSDDNGRRIGPNQTSSQESLVLFETPAKTDVHPTEQSPASYALSGYNRRITHFFEVLLPEEFRPGKGAMLYTRRLLLEHTWIPLFAPFREDAPPRCQRWAGTLLGRVSAYITLVTILAAFMFPDDGRCEPILDKGKCLTDASVMTPIYGTPMCEWDSFAQACYFGQPEVDLFQVLLYVFIISVLTAPLVKLQETFVLEATKQPWFTVSPYRPLDRALNCALHWIHKNFLEKAPPKPKKVLTDGELGNLISQKVASEKRAVTISANGPTNKIVPYDGGSDSGYDEALDREATLSVQDKEQPGAILANTAAVAPGADDGADDNEGEEVKDDGGANTTSVGTPQANLTIDLSGGHGDPGTDNDLTDTEKEGRGPVDFGLDAIPSMVLPSEQLNNPASPQPLDSGLSPPRRNSRSSATGGSANNSARRSSELALSPDAGLRSKPGSALNSARSDGSRRSNGVGVTGIANTSDSARTPKQSPRTGAKFDSTRKATGGDLGLNLATIEESTPEALAAMERARRDEEVAGDEFRSIQTTRGKMLRAARLAKAQSSMEYATPYDEASLLAQRVYNDVRRESNLIVNTMVKQVDTPRVKSRYEYRFHEEQKRRGRIDDDSIVAAVTQARQKAAAINKEVDLMIYDYDREAHLMRHFLIDNLSGYSREVAPRYLFSRNNMPDMIEEDISIATRAAAATKQFFYLCVLLGVVGFEFLFVMVYGGAILGSKAFEMWQAVLLTSVLIDACFMQFAIIYLRCVVLRNTFMAEVSFLCKELSERSRIIMMRTFGNMREATSYQQHLNPACRVARQHPHLPISRLLLSVQDVDVPLESDFDRQLAKMIPLGLGVVMYYQFSSWLERAGKLPLAAQDGLTEMTTILLANAIFYVLYTAAQTSPSAAYGIASVLVALAMRGHIIRIVMAVAGALTRAGTKVAKEVDAKLTEVDYEDKDGEKNEFGEGEDEGEDEEGKDAEKKSRTATDRASALDSPQNQLLMGLRSSQTGRGTAGKVEYLDGADGPDVISPLHGRGGKLFEARSPLGQPAGLSPYGFTSPDPRGTTRLTMQTPGTAGSLDSTYGQTGPPAFLGGVGADPGATLPGRLAPLHQQDIIGGPPIQLMSKTTGPEPSARSPYNSFAPRGGASTEGPWDQYEGATVNRPVLPPLRRVGALPTVSDVVPSSGAAPPYRPLAPTSGYGVNTLLSTADLVSVEDDKLFSSRPSDRTAASEQERMATMREGGTILNDAGPVSGPSESLLHSPLRTDVPTSSTLPEAAYLLYDTSSPPIPERATDTAAQDPVLIMDKLLSPLQVSGPKVTAGGFDGERSRRHRPRDRDRDRTRDKRDKKRSSSKRRGGRDRDESRRRRRRDDSDDDSYDSYYDEEAVTVAIRDTRPVRGPDAGYLVSPSDASKRGKFGYVQQQTREEKQRLRLQQRIQRRHKASERDFSAQEEEQRRAGEEEERERQRYLENKDVERGLAGPGALVRDRQSGAPSVRDHILNRRNKSTRYREDAAVQQEHGYLSRRAGPGDKSLESLEREPAADTVLARFGMLLVPAEEDRNIPAVALAYDAHEEQQQNYAQHADASNDEDDYHGVSVRRANNSDAHAGQGGRPGSREARGARPGSQSRRGRNNIPESGPGASSLRGTAVVRDFPSLGGEDSGPGSPIRRQEEGPQVVHKPSQKFPMWTA